MHSTPSSETTHWIGVDWGGSGFRVWRVVVREFAPLALAVVGEPAQRRWPRGAFRPVPLAEQLLQVQAGGMSYTEAEADEARDRIGLVARAVARLASSVEGARWRVAVAAPGLRVKGERGLAVVRNGPRCPDLCARLAERLDRHMGSAFEALERLVGDGLATAWGEVAAMDGALRDGARAYSLAGGSGLAEAFVIDGRPRALDQLAGVEKAWQLRAPDGEGYEDLLSPARINASFAARVGTSEPLSAEQLPEAGAEAGDEAARELLASAARAFAALVALRASEVAGLQRVVVGQALANMLAQDWFRARVDAELAAHPALSKLELRLSSLRAAPAIGAVALALDAEQRSGGAAAP